MTKMSTIERLKEIDSILRAESWYSEKYQALPQTWVDLGRALPKLLAAIQAGDALSFQYQGMLDWISNPECECCHCDHHDKLVEVLEKYRKAKAELGEGAEKNEHD